MKLLRNYPAILISVAVTLFVFDGVYAQVQKGDMNIGLSSSVTTQSGSPRNMNITGLLSAERYFTKNISVGLAPLLSIITSEGSLTSVYGVNIFGNYNFQFWSIHHNE